MEFHIAAAIFPMMDREAFEEFVADIQEHGQLEDIITYQGKIIDGRNRFRACKILGIEPRFREWDGKGNLTAHVVSLNLHRRHLQINQRAMLGVTIEKSLVADAEARMLAGVKVTYPTALGREGTTKGESSRAVGAVVDASGRTIDRARFILKHGSAELIAAVYADQVAIKHAVEIAKLPDLEQKLLVAKGLETMKARALQLLKEKPAPELSEKEKSRPIAAKGYAAVAKYLDARINYWSGMDNEKYPHALSVFEELRVIRQELCGK